MNSTADTHPYTTWKDTMALLMPYTILNGLSNICSMITILMCLVAKVPQIQTLFTLKSAKGMLKDVYSDTNKHRHFTSLRLWSDRHQ